MNIHRSSILSIIIVVTGLLIVVRAAPTLCGQVFAYFATKWGNSGQTSYDMQGTLVTAIQLIIGLLMIGNQRQIVNFIERKRRNTSIENGHQI